MLSLAALLLLACTTPEQKERALTRVDLGRAYLDERDGAGAIGILEEAVRLDPRNWDAWNKLGLAYGMLGAADKAEKAFQKAIRLSNNNAEPLNNYGAWLLSQGRSEEAIAALEQARLDLAYRNPVMVLSNLGYAYTLNGQPRVAVPVLNDAVRRAPAACEPHLHRGLALRALGEARAALEDFEVVIEKCGDTFASAHLHAGDLLVSQGDRPGGCHRLQVASEVGRGSAVGQDAWRLIEREC